MCSGEREEKRETHGECIDHLQEPSLIILGSVCLWRGIVGAAVEDQAIIDQGVLGGGAFGQCLVNEGFENWDNLSNSDKGIVG